jgi:hypothetical protein
LSTDYLGLGGIADPSSIKLETRERHWIRNQQRIERAPASMRAAEAICHRRVNGEIETRSLSGIYNCFGLVFAARRTAVEPLDVERILREDQYRWVQQRERVVLGDIIIYRERPGNEPTHVGLIVAMDYDLFRANRAFLVLSQWGFDGEYLHREDVVPAEYGQHREYYTDRRAF